MIRLSSHESNSWPDSTMRWTISLAESVVRFTENGDRARDLFLAVLGHDLRTPLSTVKLTSYALLSRATDVTGVLRQGIERIAHSADRRHEIVDDMLDFTRARLGRPMSRGTDQCDVGEMCEQVVDEIRSSNPARKILVERGADLAYATTTQVIITVRNFGPAIPDAQIATMFNAFTRGDTNTAWNYGATKSLGLGLYIAGDIVTTHGGTIDVQSTIDSVRFLPPAFRVVRGHIGWSIAVRIKADGGTG
jgi:signal transduction histidine kinase